MEMAQNRKNILYAITKSNRGGAQRYVFDLATSLPPSYAPSVLLGGEGPLKKHLEEHGVPVVSLPELERDVNLLKDVAVFFALVREFRAQRPDVVHLNSSKIGGLGALAARLTGVPSIVFTAHGWAFNEDRPALQKIVIKFLYWTTIVLSTRTIVVSDNMRRDVRSFPFVQKKISVIHNGIELVPLLSRDEAREKIKMMRGMEHVFDGSPTIIGTLAELHRVKGIDVLIEAAASLAREGRAIRAIVMGEGEERPRLERLIKERGLEQIVLLAGYLENAARYLRAFDIFALPSRSEGFSFAILEAGNAELPVAASSVGGIPEIITDRMNGFLVSPDSPAELAERLRTLCDDPTLRARLGTSLAETVRMRFSKQKMLEATLVLY